MLRMWSPELGTGANRCWALLSGLFVLLAAAQTQAQDLCLTSTTSLVGFNVSKTQACVGEQISISNASASYANVTYYTAYDRKGTPLAGSGQTLPAGTTVTQTRYSGPGVYTILQTGSANGTGFTYCRTIEIVADYPLAFTPTSCGNRTATLTATFDARTSTYDRFGIDWGDGTMETRTRAEIQAGSVSHAYGGQLTYFPVKVQGLYDNGGCPGQESTRYVTISGGGRPAVTALTTVADGTLSLSYQGTGESVVLQQKDAAGVYKATGQTATNGSFTIKTDTKQVQCFKVVAASTCPGVQSQESEEVCSLVLDVQPTSQQNAVSWQPYAGNTPVFTQYQLNRNTLTAYTVSSKSVTSYTDQNNIQCGVSYCYTLKATLQGQTTTTITSAPVCVTGINTSGNTVIQKPAVTSLRTNADGTITLNYQSDVPVEVQQKDGSGTYKPLSTTGTNGALTIPADTKQVQCFKLVTKSPCGPGQESEEVCSLVLDAKAASKQNDLTWQAYAGSATNFTRYRVYRDGTPLVPINDRGTTTYSDKDNIECGKPYCYYLEATVRGLTETTITSAPICVTGINSVAPAGLQNVFVTIEDGAVRVQGTAPVTSNTSQFTVTVSRADGTGGPFQPIGTVANSLLYIDNTANTNQQSYCYQLTYQSSCGPPSPPSPAVCTISLTAKSPTGIDWSADSPFTPGTVANYILETLDTQDNTTMFRDLAGNTHFDPPLNDPNVQRYRYRIVAYDANGTPSYSNYYEFRQEAKIYAPTAFTPDGNGHNDTFIIQGLFVDQSSLTIYNRWGDAVYQTTDATMSWDGTINGQPAPAGTYAYRLNLTDLTGKRSVKSGPILLIR